jgi:predicted hydrolase (HD superfamily)
LIEKYLTSSHLKLHSLETEAVMRWLARKLWEDEDLRGITWLLHDLDLDTIGEDLAQHGKKTVEILQSEWYNIPEMFDAILSHTEWVFPENKKRITTFDYCLAAGENITGLIYAYTLMRPDKKIEWVEIKSIKKRLKELRFAANVNRAFIADCEKAWISVDEFLQIALDSMKSIADQIWI